MRQKLILGIGVLLLGTASAGAQNPVPEFYGIYA